MILAIDAAIRDGWRECADPGELFIQFWIIAGKWDAADRAILPKVPLVVRHKLAAAIDADAGSGAVAKIVDVLEEEWPAGTEFEMRLLAAGLLVVAMHAIEDVFTPLHPRTRNCAPSLSAAPTIPDWLDAAERRRLRYGNYAQHSDRRLIPNGPFSRHARGRSASSGDRLQDHFPILTVAPIESKEQDRVISIDMKVIGTDAMRGVPGSASIGRERIQFIPLAEAKDDLSFTTHDRSGKPVIDVRPNIDTPQRLLEALSNCASIDIAFAPELTIPSSGEAQIREGIAALGMEAPRITLAGSGLSEVTSECGRSWNEARVFGRGGILLWRQRKIWPYGMDQQTAVGYGFNDPGVEEMLMEDIAGHSRIEVVDIDGFGRCVILICQDIQAQPVVDEILIRYQPDWVLTPVLDPGVRKSGWAHQRTDAISKKVQSRILVGSSLTLSHYGTGSVTEPPVGLAMGPAEAVAGPGGNPELRRAIAIVEAVAGPSPRIGILVWNHTGPTWSQSNLTVG